MKSRITNHGSYSPRFPKNLFAQISIANCPISEVLLLTICLLDPNKDRNMYSKFQECTNRLLGISVADFWLNPFCNTSPSLSSLLTNASEGTGGR